MKTITYNQGINIITALLRELESKNEIAPKNEIEYNILHDCLITHKAELTNELNQQKLISKFNNFKRR